MVAGLCPAPDGPRPIAAHQFGGSASGMIDPW